MNLPKLTAEQSLGASLGSYFNRLNMPKQNLIVVQSCDPACQCFSSAEILSSDNNYMPCGTQHDPCYCYVNKQTRQRLCLDPNKIPSKEALAMIGIDRDDWQLGIGMVCAVPILGQQKVPQTISVGAY